MNSNTAFGASLACYEIYISLEFQLAVIKIQQRLFQRYYPFTFSSIFLNFFFFFLFWSLIFRAVIGRKKLAFALFSIPWMSLLQATFANFRPDILSVYIFGVYVLCCLRWDKTFVFFIISVPAIKVEEI